MKGSHWHGRMVALCLGCAFAALVWQGSRAVPEVLLTPKGFDVWFEGDLSRVVADMSVREANHGRTKTHPLFLLATHPAVFAIKHVAGVEPLVAIRVLMAAVAFGWIVALFALCRLLGCRIVDATLLSLLGASSAASVFWFTVPETFGLGSLTILLALLVSARAELRPVPLLAWVAVNVATLGITITNWMAGLLATAVHQTRRRTVEVAAYAFSITTVLWGVQKYLYPTATFFLGERDFATNWNVLNPEGAGGLSVLLAFFFHSLLMPAFELTYKPYKTQVPLLSVQHATPGEGALAGLPGTAAWAVLLGVGLWALMRGEGRRRFRICLGSLLAGQLVLHLLYGDETFLYALHAAAILVPLAALGATTRLRPLVLTLLLVLLPLALANNLREFNRASAWVQAQTVAPPARPPEAR